MREIKFRGRRIDNGEWMFGDLVRTGADYYGKNSFNITTNGSVMDYAGLCFNAVDPATVGQFTGLLDKNSKEIYEGDIVKAWSQGDCGSFEIVWRQASTPCWILYPAWRGEFWHLHGTLREDGRWHDNVEVIGNIHENPELLSSPTPWEQIPDGGMEE